MYRWIEPQMPAVRPTETKDDLKEALIDALKTEAEERLEPLDAAIKRAQTAYAQDKLDKEMYETAKGLKPLYTLAYNERRRLNLAKEEERTPPPAPWETGKVYRPGYTDVTGKVYRASSSAAASRPKRQRGGGGGE